MKNVSAGAGAVGMFPGAIAKWAPAPQVKGVAAIINGASLIVIAGTNTLVPINPENIKLRTVQTK